jgi:multicomponent Na+:H+ antiporter subunit B
LLIALSLIVLYRGHNFPGGGFIGGLLAASAILLYVLDEGWARVEKARRLAPSNLIFAGLLTALSSGLPALFLGLPFMTGLWLPALKLPVIGKIALGTPFLFDVGVYLAVIGFTLKCALALGTAPHDPPPSAPH